MKRVRPTVVIYRDLLLTYSETFIAAQAGALANWRPLFAGTKRREGVPLTEADVEVTQGRAELIAFKALRHAPARWVRAISARDPKLVHAHFGPDGFWAIPLSRALGVPLIVTFHGHDVTARATSSPLYAAYSLLRPRVFRSAAIVIAVSTFLADRLLAQGCPPEKLIVHHIGVDTTRFRTANVQQREATVLFVGRLVEKKGCEYLLRAMADVQQRHPHVELVIVGDGPLREKLQRQASALRNVRFTGPVSSDAVRDLMERASVLCLPSVTARNGLTEGLPITLIEAQSMGLPVVSTLHSGNPDAVRDGETGLLVPERDVGALASALNRLLDDASLRSRMSDAAASHVRAHFDLRKQTAILETIYDRTAASRPVPRSSSSSRSSATS